MVLTQLQRTANLILNGVTVTIVHSVTDILVSNKIYIVSAFVARGPPPHNTA